MRRIHLGKLFSSESGFSLVELLGVAVIIIVLSLMAIPVYANVTDTVRKAESLNNLKHVHNGLERYMTEHGHYPSRLSQLVDKGYVKSGELLSPWSSASNTIYFYYAVDTVEEGITREFILGDAGPGIKCLKSKLTPPCGKDPKSPAYQDMAVPEGLEHVFRSR